MEALAGRSGVALCGELYGADGRRRLAATPGFSTASRADRAAIARGDKKPEKPEADMRARFAQDFDRDPGVATAAATAAGGGKAGSGG